MRSPGVPFVPGAQINRFTQAWRSLLSLKGEASEAKPEISLESDRPEYSFLKGERLGFDTAAGANVAGNFTVAQLFNPANSGILVVVTRIWFGVGAVAANIGLNDSEAGMTLLTNRAMRDTRWRTGTSFVNALVAHCNIGSVAAIPGNFTVALARGAFLPKASNWDFDVQQPIVLAPGTGVWTAPNVVNQANETLFWWYERPLEPSEVTSKQQ